MNQNPNKIIEIGIIGDKDTGKTSLLNNYFGMGFEKDMTSTIGIDRFIKEIESIKNKKYKLKIIDTAGQEVFRSLVLSIFKNCKGLILVYAIDDEKSFENVKFRWIQDINDSLDMSKTPIILVGNKIDLKDERIISEEEGQKLANDNNFEFLETSAKTGENVNEIFQTIFEIIVKDIEKDVKIKEINNNVKEKTFKLGNPKKIIHRKCC